MIHYQLDDIIPGPILAAGPAPGWHRTYDLDALALANLGIRHSFCLLEDYDYSLRTGEITLALAEHGIKFHHFPMIDMRAPKIEQMNLLLNAIEHRLGRGESCYVHCVAGLGRTGTSMACLLVRHGWSAEDAIREIRRRRPQSICTPGQARFVRKYQPPVLSAPAQAKASA